MTRCRSILTLLAVLALLIARASAEAAQPPFGESISLDRFISELDRLIGDVRVAQTAAAGASITATVPERWRVTAGDQTIDVSARWLTVALVVSAKHPEQWVSARTNIVRRLTEIRDQAATFAFASTKEARADARAMVLSILDREEFRRSAASRWVEDLRQRLGRWFENLMNRFGGGPVTGRRVAIGLAWAAAIAALAGLGLLLARSIARPGGTALNLAGQGMLRPRARELALRAVAEARAGHSRESVRLAYNAALVRLEEQGAWRVDDARTPREYLPMLRAGDARHPLMLDLTQRFERIWYGNRAVAADDTPRVTAHLEELGCLRPGERVI